MGPFVDLDSLALLRFLAAPMAVRWRLAAPFVARHVAHHEARYDALWPLLFAALKAQALTGEASPEVLATLEERWHDGMGRALLKHQFLAELKDALPGLQASVILLKGAAFDAALYGPSEPRLGHDIDLLATREMAARIGAWLLEKGFAYVPPEIGPRRTRRFFAKSYVRETPFPLEIDLHEHVAEPALFKLPHSLLFAQAAPHPAYGSPRLLTLTPELSVLLLLVQALRDLELLPLTLIDLTHLLPLVDGAKLAELARSQGLATPLALLASSYDACFSDVGEAFPLPQKAAGSPLRMRLATPLFHARLPETNALEHAQELLRRMASQYLLLDDTRCVLRFQSLALWDRLGDFASRRPEKDD